MRKRFIAIILVIAISAAVFAACSKNSEQPSKPNIRGLEEYDSSSTPEKSGSREEIDMESEPDNEFVALLPTVNMQPKDIINSEFGITVVYGAIGSGDYDKLIEAAREKGFTVEESKAEATFGAKNSDDYYIKIERLQEETRVSVYKDSKHFDSVAG